MKMMRWAMAAVLLVIVVSAGIAVYTVFFGSKDLAVPRLREMSVMDAMEEVKRELGLKKKKNNNEVINNEAPIKILISSVMVLAFSVRM